MDKIYDLLHNIKVTVFLDYVFYLILIVITIWTAHQIINLPIKERLSQMRYRSKLKRSRAFSKNEKPLEERSPLYRHIYFLLKSSNDEGGEHVVSNFFFLSGLLFVAILCFSVVKFEDLVISLIFAILVSIIPYTILQIKLRSARNTIGNQVNKVTEMLVSSYSASGYNIYEALKYTHAHIEEPSLKRVFSKLINDLQTARNDEELRTTIDVFIYTCGNTWSKRLGNVILKAYVYHENVANTLLTLQSQMQNTEKMLEQEKSNSMDAVYDGYLPIFIFPASIGLAYYVTGPQDWFKLQFGQTWSLFLFIVCAIFTIFSLMVSLLLRKPKNDL
ncbi:hypothetical protein [Bacillus sp. RO1]|uniref:type II secretion system F family protein n=1 Tax=Bacillus sp. RO1 TaxID=2722703 RepID=UPI0014578147|nr:hypothetical protein [Bacillus sp. RO1]NLP52201.1 hypothetical protein [Bacillus sp. RO1]